MKKLLSLLVATGLVATTSATVVACGDPSNDKTWDQLAVEAGKKAIEKDGGWVYGTDPKNIEKAGLDAAKTSIGDNWADYSADNKNAAEGKKTINIVEDTTKVGTTVKFKIQAYEAVVDSSTTKDSNVKYKWEKVGDEVKTSTTINEKEVISISQMTEDLLIEKENITEVDVVEAFIKLNESNLPNNITKEEFTAKQKDGASNYAFKSEKWIVSAKSGSTEIKDNVEINVNYGLKPVIKVDQEVITNGLELTLSETPEPAIVNFTIDYAYEGEYISVSSENNEIAEVKLDSTKKNIVVSPKGVGETKITVTYKDADNVTFTVKVIEEETTEPNPEG